jgi:excisionase family DNA binding protein
MDGPKSGRPLSTAEAAARLGCSKSQVTQMARDGQLRGFRVGVEWRFLPEQVEQYIREFGNAQQPAAAGVGP